MRGTWDKCSFALCKLYKDQLDGIASFLTSEITLEVREEVTARIQFENPHLNVI